MILAVDVHYPDSGAVAAGVLFGEWSAPTPDREIVTRIETVAPYRSGAFYLRELPCVEALLAELAFTPDCIVVDGYVTLGPERRPGLGWRLWESLGRRAPVVGVAKTAFSGSPDEAELFRGASRKPLYIGAAGIELDEAKRHIAGMAGSFRLPDLLRRVDRLSRA